MIEIDHLTKRYGGHTAVDDISFTCEPGRVTGFLGPNGAGKTTTLRILAGLTPATGGQVLIGGHRYRDLPNPARHVGTLLDASAQHAGRTGREVLTLGARMTGVGRDRVEELLALVGLDKTEARRRIRNYSLGMRQRLGLAHALLGDPSVLVLDEPANGLDPAGIRWMRDLLSGYAERGGTVLLSSHLLAEVQLIADHLVMIGRGRIVAEGTVQSLTAGRGSILTTTDPAALRRALVEAGHQVRPGATPDELDVDAEPEEVGTIAAAHRLVLTGLRPTRAGLEDLFLSLTADTQRDAVAVPSTTTTGAAA